MQTIVQLLGGYIPHPPGIRQPWLLSFQLVITDHITSQNSIDPLRTVHTQREREGGVRGKKAIIK